MSILDQFLGDDEDSTESSDDASDPFLDGDDDDPFAETGEDDLGAFNEMESEGPDTAELENRIDELENEFSSLSSDVGTIKSENEEISDSLDDIEENVRQLLEIYEMVTRGVNPFVDESDVSATSGSMDLFDTDAGSDDQSEDIDESIADADADEFFDEDLSEGGGSDDMSFEEGDDGGADPFADDDEDFAADFDDESSETDGGEESGGKSFDDLKAEYESGDADWADDGGDVTDDGDEFEDDDEFELGAVDEEGTIEEVSESGDEATVATTDGEADAEIDEGDEPSEQDETAGDGSIERPYLDSLDPGYGNDLLVLEWLQFLVDQSTVEDAARSIAYYETIDWISESVAERLQTFLVGFDGGEDIEDDPQPHPSLAVDYHVESLRYISRLEGSSEGALLLNRKDWAERTIPLTDLPASESTSADDESAAAEFRTVTESTDGGVNASSSSEAELREWHWAGQTVPVVDPRRRVAATARSESVRLTSGVDVGVGASTGGDSVSAASDGGSQTVSRTVPYGVAVPDGSGRSDPTAGGDAPPAKSSCGLPTQRSGTSNRS